MMVYYLYWMQPGKEQSHYQPVQYQKPYQRKSAALATAKRLAHLRKLEFFAAVEIPESDGEIPPATIPDDDERLKHIFQDVYTSRDMGIKRHRHGLTPLTVKITTTAPPEGIEVITDPATGRTSSEVASWQSEQPLEKGKGWGGGADACPDISGERLWLLDLIGKVKAEPNYALPHYTALEEIYRDFYGDY
ncbi:MAG: hypothetical protein HXX20_16130 [Chloroflexi bacterium]|nr:hypothetical protein [Chloroflexota bacterium]